MEVSLLVKVKDSETGQTNLSGEKVESLLADNSLSAELVVRTEAGRVGTAGGGADLVLLLQ